MIALLIFWISILLVLHTYILYPAMLSLFSRGKKGNQVIYDRIDEDLPFVSIIMAAYNEESCIREKLESIYAGNYPPEKFEVLIGSDASRDGTVEVARSAVSEPGTANLSVFDFPERRGKQNVVNDLVQESKGEILVLTDANVMFDADTVFYMIRHFKNPDIGLVDTNMINRGMKESGISYQEKAYISREVGIKDMESRLWGAMMGPFGGCYAIRREDFEKVPSNFLVDDFYINMKVFEKGKLAINDINARVYEDLPEELRVEFRRKVRIGTGDFQNLRKFWRLIFTRRYGFAFLSHKVFRWFGPFFLLMALIANFFLVLGNTFYLVILALHVMFYIVPVIDWTFKKMGHHFAPFRLVTHFVSMNAALFLGFFRSMKTIRSGIWERTDR